MKIKAETVFGIVIVVTLILAGGEYFLYRNVMHLKEMTAEGLMMLKEQAKQNEARMDKEAGSLMMKDGAVMMQKGTEMVKIDKEVTLPSGTKVMMDGTVVMKDGTTRHMQEGEMMDMDK